MSIHRVGFLPYLHNLVQLWGSSPAPVDERHTGCTKLAKGLTWLEDSYLNQCYKRLQSIKSQTIPFFCSGVLPCLESIVCCLNSCLEICASWYEVHWVLRLITWVSSVDMSGTEQRTWSISKFPLVPTNYCIWPTSPVAGLVTSKVCPDLAPSHLVLNIILPPNWS